PTAGWLVIGWVSTLVLVASRATGLVMSLMVRSPVILILSSPADSTAVLLKVACGYLAASKKSSLRRWSSNAFTCEDRPASGRMTSTLDAATLSASYVMMPSTWPKWAIGFEKPRWFHCATTSVWVGSMV